MTLNLTDEDKATLFKEIEAHLASVFAPAQTASVVSALDGWKKKMMADGSFGRVFNGPQWLDGIAIRDGGVSGKKLQAQLVISNLFTTVDETITATADRMNLDSTSLRWYGTVSGTPNTKIAEFSPAGFSIGTTNPITYVAATGLLTVPAAVITSLTIANVGSGNLGGSYATSSSNPKMVFDTSGHHQYNSGGTLVSELKNDGSGFLGSTGGSAASAALAWTTTPTISLKGTITIGSGGKIVDGDGSYWDQSGIVLAATGTVADTIAWQTSSTNRGYVTADSTHFVIQQLNGATGGGSVLMTATQAILGFDNIASNTLTYVKVDDSTGFVDLAAGGYATRVNSSGHIKAGDRIYPGNAGQQSTGYLDWDSGGPYVRVSGAALSVPSGLVMSSGALSVTSTGTATGVMPSATKWWIIFDATAGAFRYIPMYTSPTNWTA